MARVAVVKGWGLRLMAAFLILFGLMTAAQLSFQGSHIVLGALAIVAGVLILIDM